MLTQPILNAAARGDWRTVLFFFDPLLVDIHARNESDPLQLRLWDYAYLQDQHQILQLLESNGSKADANFINVRVRKGEILSPIPRKPMDFDIAMVKKLEASAEKEFIPKTLFFKHQNKMRNKNQSFSQKRHSVRQDNPSYIIRSSYY